MQGSMTLDEFMATDDAPQQRMSLDEFMADDPLADKYTEAYQQIVAQADDPTEQGHDAYNRNLKLAADMEQANRGPITGSAPYRVAEDIITAGASGIVNPLLAGEAKLGIPGADDMLQQRQAQSDISHLREQGWGQKITGGIGESLAEFGTLALAGGGIAQSLGLAGKAYKAAKWAMIGGGLGSNSYSQAHRDATKDGKTEEEADKIATATAAWEVGVMGVFQKIGLGGAERAVAAGLGANAAKGAAARTSLQGLKNFFVQTTGELAEEEITTLAQTLASTGGVGGWREYLDTAAATIGTMGLLAGSQRLIDFTSNPSRRTAKAAGLNGIATTQRERENVADQALLAASQKINTDWVKTDPASTAVEGEVVDEPTTATERPEFTTRDEEALAALTRRLKRKLKTAGFRPDEMGVTVDNFQSWFRDRGYEQLRPGVRTEGVTTNEPEPAQTDSPSQEIPPVDAPVADEVQQPTPAPSEPRPGPTTPEGPVQMAAGIPISKATARWFKQNFTSGGEANKPILDAAFRRDGRIRGHVKQASQNSVDLQKAVRKEFGIPLRQQIPDTISTQLNEALRDPSVMATLPQSVAVPLTEMRDHIDGISQVVASLPGINADLQLSIQQNLGKYVTRTYKKFGQNPQAWMDKALADPQIMTDFATEVRTTSPNATDDEIYQLAQILLQRDTASLGDVGFPAGASTKKYTDVLKKRKDLSPAIRQLYGERTDAFENYAETIGKLASLTAHRQFADEVLQTGLQQGFISPVNAPAPGHTKEVNHQQIKQLSPLAGHVMPVELADALNTAYTVSKPGWSARQLLKLSGAAKASATVLSWQATIRNLTGNIPIAMANGAFNPADFAKSSKTIWWQDMLNKGDKAAKAEIADLNRLGLMEDTSVSELNSMAKDVADSVQDYIGGINPTDHWKRTTRGVSRFYQSMDSVWKVHTFYNYLPKYRAANPQMTEPELREHVAKIVREITPTYSEASKAAKFASRYFPLGPFAMFSAEMWRTTANRVRLSLEEIKSGNPELAKIGYQRMAGQAAAVGGMTALAMTIKAALGVSDEDEEAIRHRVAPWQRNAILIPTNVDKKTGKVEFFDASYNDPFSIFSEPAMALWRGRNDEAAAAIAEPFISEDIAYGVIVSLLRRTDENNRPIYDPGLSPMEQNLQIAKYVAAKFMPGTLRSAERIRKGVMEETSPSGRQYGAGNEALSAIAGVKLDTMDRAQSDYYRNREYNGRIQDSGSAIRRAFLQRGTVDLSALEETYRSADTARQKAMKEWRQYVDGSVQLGEQNPYAKVVSDVGSESDIVKSMYTGNYVPYTFRTQDLRKMLQLPDGQARVDLWKRLYTEQPTD
jgi:hypothetical protein